MSSETFDITKIVTQAKLDSSNVTPPRNYKLAASPIQQQGFGCTIHSSPSSPSNSDEVGIINADDIEIQTNKTLAVHPQLSLHQDEEQYTTLKTSLTKNKKKKPSIIQQSNNNSNNGRRGFFSSLFKSFKTCFSSSSTTKELIECELEKSAMNNQAFEDSKVNSKSENDFESSTVNTGTTATSAVCYSCSASPCTCSVTTTSTTQTTTTIRTVEPSTKQEVLYTKTTTTTTTTTMTTTLGESNKTGSHKKHYKTYKRRNHKNQGTLLPPQRDHVKGKKTLVLDLDETLVHSVFNPIHDADFVIPIEMEGRTYNCYVRKRPGVDKFLLEMSKHFEIVIFTASLALYANPLLDVLDVHKVIEGRLFREHCTRVGETYVKDLDRLGRDVDQTLIVDNSPSCYALHPHNALAASTWVEDKTDTELLLISDWLNDLAKDEKVYESLRLFRNRFGPTNAHTICQQKTVR
ncbi:hypothetical protein ABK040_001296 [Willaertia magna]